MMELTDKERQQLIREAALQIAVFNCKNSLLNREQIGALLGRSYNRVSEIVNDPTFPPAVRLTENGHRQWKSRDVWDWIDSRRTGR